MILNSRLFSILLVSIAVSNLVRDELGSIFLQIECDFPHGKTMLE